MTRRRLPKTLTVKILKKQDACNLACLAFKRQFPKGLKMDPKVMTPTWVENLLYGSVISINYLNWFITRYSSTKLIDRFRKARDAFHTCVLDAKFYSKWLRKVIAEQHQPKQPRKMGKRSRK